MKGQALLAIICLVLHWLPRGDTSDAPQGANRKKYSEQLLPHNVSVLYFYYKNVKKTYREAYDICWSDLDGSLFVPYQEMQLDYIMELFEELKTTKVWIGIHSLYAPQDFVTVNSFHMDAVYVKWAEKQPEKSKSCVAMKNKEYYAEDCESKKPFLCMKGYPRRGFRMYCSDVAANYIAYENEDGCYKVFDEPLTWEEAFRKCHDERARLPYVTSKTRATELVKVMRKAKSKHLAEHGSVDADTTMYHVAFSSHISENSSDYAYPNWASLDETGYSEWSLRTASNHPNYPGVNCGTLVDADNELSVTKCNETKHFFACEKFMYAPHKFVYHAERDNSSILLVTAKEHPPYYDF